MMREIAMGLGRRLRVSQGNYKERPYLHARIWVEAPDGEYRPTTKGLTLPLEQARQMAQAILAEVGGESE